MLRRNLLTLTGGGSVLVRTSQERDAPFSAAPAVERTLTVNKAIAPIRLHDPTRAYDGMPELVTANTTPAGVLCPTARSVA